MQSQVVALEGEAGSIAVWNDFTWHGSTPRKKPGLRLTLVQQYMRSYMRPLQQWREEDLAPGQLERYPELADSARVRLLVVAGEVGGRWSDTTAWLLRRLAAAKAAAKEKAQAEAAATIGEVEQEANARVEQVRKEAKKGGAQEVLVVSAKLQVARAKARKCCCRPVWARSAAPPNIR